jgi:hypothetical protein
MENLSRRSFLQKGSVAAGAVGMAAALPTLARLPRTSPAAVNRKLESQSPARNTNAISAANRADREWPIVAHLRSLETGDIDVFVGDRRITLHDPATAGRLYQATR